ncbi:efflux RND transporter permease subunit [bacterium]|nr:efflux RND transporter permease subunit [bacterium]
MKKHLFFRRPVTFFCIFGAIFVASLFALKALPVSFLPQVTGSHLYVRTHWPGASAERIEAEITAPIEPLCFMVKGIESVESYSYPNYSLLDISLDENAPIHLVELELNEKLHQLRPSLPATIQTPMLSPDKSELDLNQKLLTIKIYGDAGANVMLEQARQLQREARKIEGVSKAELWGESQPHLKIIIDPTKIEYYGIELTELIRTIRDLSYRLHPGEAVQDGLCFTMSSPAIEDHRDIQRAIVREDSDKTVCLGDLATIRVSSEEPASFSEIDGKPVMTLNIYRDPDVNLLKLSGRIKNRLDELSPTLQKHGISILIRENLAESVRDKLLQLYKQLAFCLILMVLLLLLFIHNFRLVFVVITGVLYTLLTSLLIFYLFRIEINVVTLSALVLSLGILIDNAIVVSESLYQKQRNMPDMSANLNEIYRELPFPLLVSTLTTAIVFLPFIFLDKEFKAVLFPFAWAVIISTFLSLLISFTLVPFIFSRLHGLITSRKHRPKTGSALFVKYTGFLLKYRTAIITLFSILFLVSMAILIFVLPRTEMTFRWEDKVVVHFSFNRNSELQDSESLVREIENQMSSFLPYIEHYMVNATRKEGLIEISFPENVGNTNLPSQLKNRLASWGAQKDNVDLLVKGPGQSFTHQEHSIPQYILKLKGYNYQYLKNLAVEIGARLQENRRVQNLVFNNTSESVFFKGASSFKLRFDQGFEGLHLNPLQSALYKLYPYLNPRFYSGFLEVGQQRLPYSMYFKDSEKFNLQQLVSLEVPGLLPRSLQHFTDLSRSEESAYIYKHDQQYQRFITYDYYGESRFGDLYLEEILNKYTLPPGFEIKKEQAFQTTFFSKDSKWLYILLLTLSLIYIIMAALYESYSVPLIIFLVIPFSFIGVAWIYFFTGSALNIYSFLSFVYLFGVVVNNSVLLIDRIHSRYLTSGDLEVALQKGLQERFRPILMTSATSVFSFLPLVLMNKDSLWYIFGLTIIGGIGFSVIVILILNPLFYFALRRIASRIPSSQVKGENKAGVQSFGPLLKKDNFEKL